MNRRGTSKKLGVFLSLVMMLTMVFSFAAMAASTDTDNSLVDLGIKTEGATLQEEFGPGTWTAHVTVPTATPDLEMEPVRSSGNATIGEIRSTDNEDGTRSYFIPVTAGSGDLFEYTVIVTATGEAQTETETESETEAAILQTEAQLPETEPETQSNQVLVDRGTIEEAENTINSLQSEIRGYRESMDLYTKIIYGLIAFAVVLLFIVINLILRKRDLKMELNDYRSLGYSNSKKAQKARAKEEKKAAKEQAKAEQYGAPQQAPKQQAPVQKQAPAQRPAQAPQQAPAQKQAPNGFKPAQYYGPNDGLDVRPQVSQKHKQMPSYQQAPQAQKKGAPAETQIMPPIQKQAPKQAPQQAPAQKAAQPQAQAPAQKPAQTPKKDVTVEMIDL